MRLGTSFFGNVAARADESADLLIFGIGGALLGKSVRQTLLRQIRYHTVDDARLP